MHFDRGFIRCEVVHLTTDAPALLTQVCGQPILELSGEGLGVSGEGLLRSPKVTGAQGSCLELS